MNTDEKLVYAEEDQQPDAVKEDAILPEGYKEGDDIFAEDAPEETPEAAAPTTEPEQTEPQKLRFRAKVDHEEKDVELSPDELPTIWQKAQATERAQQRLRESVTSLNRLNEVAKARGYEDAVKMVTALEQEQQKTEEARLVEEGVHPEVAKDIASRKYAVPKAERDFNAEIEELQTEYPAALSTGLPDEVKTEAVRTGKPLLDVYRGYIARQVSTKAEILSKENAVLKQNAAAAQKAPVRGVTGNGSASEKAKDPILEGFEKDGW